MSYDTERTDLLARPHGSIPEALEAENRFRSHVLDRLPAATSNDLELQNLGYGTAITRSSHRPGGLGDVPGQTSTGGWRVRCRNLSSRTILPYNVAQVCDHIGDRTYFMDFRVPLTSGWPSDPLVFLERPRETGVGQSLAWVDTTIEAGAYGTCVLGGLWIVRIGWRTIWEYSFRRVAAGDYLAPWGLDYTGQPAGSAIQAWDSGLPLRASFCSRKDSFILWDLPANSRGPISLIHAKWYAGAGSDPVWPFDSYGGIDQTTWLGLFKNNGW